MPMAPSVRTFFRCLSTEAILDVFGYLRAAPPLGLEQAGAGKRATAASAAAMDGETRRGQIEAIVSEISALTSKPDLAELALRAVCHDQPVLLATLEGSQSLDERCWRVWRSDSKLIDRARNVAMKYHWQDSRFHSAFEVSNPGNLKSDLSDAVAAIQDLVQGREGGRRAETDTFSYHDPDTPAGTPPAVIHHIAVYLERPARYLMEFGEGEAGVQPIIRHEARELAITYNERTGRLDVSGYGVGGHMALKDIATVFHAEAVENSEMNAVSRRNWRLDVFLAAREPPLCPPEGFVCVRVIELRLRARDNATRRASFKSDAPTSAYDRLHDLGIKQDGLGGELVAGVVLSLQTFQESDDRKPRDVRIRLDWPARRHFDNASIGEQKVLDAWLARQPFAPQPA
jgi:hypothetical protein